MFEKILSKIGKVFQKHRIPYMVIGGQAVLLYGEPRLTRDIDLTLGVDTDRFDQIRSLLKPLGLTPLHKDPKSFAEKTMVLPVADKKTRIRVDFIFSFSDYEREAIQRAKKIRFGKQRVFFISPEDLVIHKIFAGRPRDLEDAESILIKNPSLDLSLVRNTLKIFDDSSNSKNFITILAGLLRQLRRL